MKFWEKWDSKINKIEGALITILLSLMILTAFSQIVLRNFFSTGIDWGDALVRYLVVWVAFIGAAIATREGKHICIDLLSHWLKGPGSIAVQALSCFFSAVISALLTVAAVKFIWFEAQMGSTTFLNLPVWIPELIMPIAFGLITLRFLMEMIGEIGTLLNKNNRNRAD
ncbi:MAG: TRAP transporter small permease [Deltaproteobacteria bacterium]|nr:TRAP transporter small permease [Deltaproteobacteria bacterium]